jgi:predicted transcriptional regulator of viral defense system
METSNLAKSTKLLYDSDLKFFTTKTIRDILSIDKESVFFDYIHKLIKNDILTKIERNKYILTSKAPDTMILANMLYQPSYISFETALNFYGILSQFPRETTCATSKKTNQKLVGEKVYSYTHIDPKLYFGYEKTNDFIIATPEKALFDQGYLTSKGIKHLNIDEYDLSRINKKVFTSYLEKLKNNQQFHETLSVINKYLHL